MRKGGLELLSGGGQEVARECNLCMAAIATERVFTLRSLPDGTQMNANDAEAIERAAAEHPAHAVMQSLPGRVNICAAHKQVLLDLGYGLGPVVQEATPPPRKRRRATKAAHRRSLPKLPAAPAPEPQGGEGGGFTF